MMWVSLGLAASFDVVEGESIQAVLDAASDGDVINVGPGLYVEQLSFEGKDLVLRSTAGPEHTVLDGDDLWDTSVVSFTSGEPITATLQGFTIQNGHGQPYLWDVGRGWVGAGVLVKSSAATILDCLFVDNNSRHSGQSLGAGLAAVNSEVVLRDNVFRDNLGFWGGGGVGLIGSRASIEGNLFQDNLGTRGAGLIVLQDSTADLVDNTFEGNRAGHGGHLFVKDSVLTSSQDRFLSGSAWRNGGGVVVQDATATFSEASFEDNRAEHDGGHLWVAWSGGAAVLGSRMAGGEASAGAVAFVREAALSLHGVLLESPSAEAIWAWQADLQLFNLTVLEPAAPLARAEGGQASLLNVLVQGGSGPLLEGLQWASSLGWQVQGGLPEGALEADPLLANGVPQPGSPAIDAGSSLFDDLDGSPADIGATGGGTPWSP